MAAAIGPMPGSSRKRCAVSIEEVIELTFKGTDFSARFAVAIDDGYEPSEAVLTGQCGRRFWVEVFESSKPAFGLALRC